MARGWVSDGQGGFTRAGVYQKYIAQFKRDTKAGKLRIKLPYGHTDNPADTVRGERAAQLIRAGQTIKNISGKQVKVTAANKANVLGQRGVATPATLVPLTGKSLDDKGNAIAGARLNRGTTTKVTGNANKGTEKVITRGTGSGKAPVIPAGLAKQWPLMSQSQRDAALNSLKGANKGSKNPYTGAPTKGTGKGGGKGKNK